MKLHALTFLLLAVGGLNWLLIGLFQYDAVMLLGATAAQVVYVLVGLSAIYEIVMHKSMGCKCCEDMMKK